MGWTLSARSWAAARSLILGGVGVCLSGAFTFVWPRLSPKSMGIEGWRLSRTPLSLTQLHCDRTELRELLNKYERVVEDDAYFLVQPSNAERQMLGPELLQRRVSAVRKEWIGEKHWVDSSILQARDRNRHFVEQVIEAPGAGPGISGSSKLVRHLGREHLMEHSTFADLVVPDEGPVG
eukprot:s2108_g13.t1